MDDLQEGDEFAGHRVLGVAGRGGMGVVFRAVQLDLDRVVALKLIAPQLAGDPAFRERFVRESRAAASIDHPNVIPIYYTGEEDGRLYIAMRYVDGSDLRTLVRAETRLAPGRAARIVAQIGGALDAAHARGIVHRDIKPANVLLGVGEHAYLTDFGLTKNVASHTGSTRGGGWVGTLGYVAPEQIRGERLDARADVYALGCVLYHAVCGVPPYQRDSDEATLWAHLHEDPPSVGERAPAIPARFEAVLKRAMAKNPDDRFPSAGDLGRAALAAAGETGPAGPERVVGIGDAAPAGEETVVTPDQAATVRAGHDAPPDAGRRGRRVLPWALAAIPVALLAVAAALARGGGDTGGGAPSAPPTTSTTAPPAASRAAGRVARTVSVGGRPNSVTVAGGSVWVSRGGNERLAIIATATGRRRAARPRVGPRPAAAAAGFGDLWAASDGAKTITPIGLESRRPDGAPVGVPSQGQIVAVGTGDSAVWAGIRSQPGLVVRIDPRAHRIAKVIELPDGVQNLAVGAGAVWILARRANTLTRLDIRTGRLQSINVGDRPSDVAVGAGAAWVTNAGDDSVTRIDTGNLSTSEIPVGRQPAGVAVSDDAVWVANRLDSTLTRIDPGTRRRVGRVVDVNSNPYALDISGHHVWVGSLGDGTVQRVDF
ncbi:MAG: protein kinase domain-containing protein [Solirubrobacteraceae bacterium]